jgi:molecular chaperone GrpE
MAERPDDRIEDSTVTGADEGSPRGGGVDGESVDGTVESEIVADLSRLEKDLERATDMRLRLAAEFDNYRKRVERERADLFERAQGELAKRLLDSIDDLDRVSEFGPETPISAMLEGVQLVERKLLAALGSAGLEEVVAAGRPFDPNEMEAVAAVSTDDPAQDDHVLDVFQKGWRFHGQLIRPARVRVMQFEA